MHRGLKILTLIIKINLKIFAIDIFKKDQNYEIVLLFFNNEAITLTSEVIEVTLEDLDETL